MRDAETVLDVIRDRGSRGLPLEDVYRQLFNPALYLRAYGRIYRNDGALTQGVTEETVDGMSMQKINTLIEAIRYERFRWTPVRRVYIEKKNSTKKRPLGIPTWTDKLLQEVIRSILEAYYEPQFSDNSHGFRPERGCHTALSKIRHDWEGTKWFIEGDVRGCFDNIDHTILMKILHEHIHDNRFLRLIDSLLKAGYCEEWRRYPTLSGTPQGGICSPILANIYLDRLDKYVEQTLIPKYTRGDERARNAEYERLNYKAWHLRKMGRSKEAKALRKQYQQIPSKDTNDPNFRRLHYVRYADDWLLGFTGPIAEAQNIKEELRIFLKDALHLELSEEKTLITHARTQAAHFLGYEIVVQHADSKHTNRRRSVNGIVALRVPAKVIEEKCALYMRDGNIIPRPELINDDDYSIIALYQSEYRGYVQFYNLAQNITWLSKVHWVMERSLLKTLACKHKTSTWKVKTQYQKIVKLPQGPRKCLEVTVIREGKKPLKARFGALQLKSNPKAIIRDFPTKHAHPYRNELINRLLAEKCEICGAVNNIQVHHIRALKDLKVKGRKEKPFWMQIMANRKRKTLVVCDNCHKAIHQGKPLINRILEQDTGEPR